MEILKRIARKILNDEIKNYKSLAEAFQKRNIELRGEMAELENKLNELSKLNLDENIKRINAEKRTEEIEKENAILRKYYDLDKEPSDEIKTKIHIDLEANRLKEENLKLIAMRSQVQYIPQPYSFYRFCRGF